MPDDAYHKLIERLQMVVLVHSGLRSPPVPPPSFAHTHTHIYIHTHAHTNARVLWWRVKAFDGRHLAKTANDLFKAMRSEGFFFI